MQDVWNVRCYHSGTINVEPPQRGPWLYVFGPGEVDGDSYSNRFAVAESLCAFLNGGPRPAWLCDMKRVAENELGDFDGTRIIATGPMIDKRPPTCWWVQDDSSDAHDARARLIDSIGFVFHD